MKTNDFVSFGDVSRGRLGQQCQYGCRYTGIKDEKSGEQDEAGFWENQGYPNLGKGLRFKGNTNDYHSLLIHKDDVETFVQRYNDWQKSELDKFNRE